MQKYTNFINVVLKPYSSILFLNNKYIGLAMLLITFVNPSVALSGIAAVIFTILFAELLSLQEAYLSQGFYIYNSLLVGMGIGYIFYPSVLSISLIAIAASFTFMLSFMFNKLFSVHKIPILSLPFSIVTMFLYLASLKYSGLLSSLVNNSTVFDIMLPLVLSGYLKSLGTIFFLPTNIAGILIFLLLLYSSRIIAIMSLVGYYFGVLVHSYLLGSYVQAVSDPYSFNYILVAIALCGIFLLPTIKNFFLALIGVAISVFLTDAIAVLFNYYAIPVFTIPFNITVIVFIFILSIIYYKEFNLNIKSTPEESLSSYLSSIFRFGELYTKISLPFSGDWTVYQSEDDEWTHKGKYKYAYDFVQKKDGLSYEKEGLYLDDYYCFGESVLSPVNGYIVDSRHDLVDNIIGEVDRVNNWGNYIIIKSDLGFYVEISHLMQYSIKLNVGDYVKVNEIIAKCGNSGYSPEPHIHIQVQDLGVIGAFTREFCFSEFFQDDLLVFNSKLLRGDVVSSVVNDRSISSRLLFILDDEYRYEVYEEGIKKEIVLFSVKMNSFGEFYFNDVKNNKLYFYNDLKQFYFYKYEGKASFLKELFILAPRIPFINKQGVRYKDYLPLYLLKSKMQTSLIELASTVNKNFYKAQKEYTFDNSCVSSLDGEVHIEANAKGFSLIKYKNIELRRVL